MRVVGLFAGVGGFELGLGGEPLLFAESDESARRVLADRFAGVPVVADVRDLDALPECDVVTAGFPCQDLSIAGPKVGMRGGRSALVSEVFRLLERRRAPVVVLENVPNMLVLGRGHAMAYVVDSLETLGYRWAYRIVDSRTTGIPQRRRRIYLVASTDVDPASVLFADEANPLLLQEGGPQRTAAWHWKDGGWTCSLAWDCSPTILTRPCIAVWHREGEPGRRVLALHAPEQLERLQGLPSGWTAAAGAAAKRCRLVGNAVTVDVVRWLGGRLRDPGRHVALEFPVERSWLTVWPSAARGERGRTWAVQASSWPVSSEWTPLDEFVDLERLPPLSAKATVGFLARSKAVPGRRFPPGFLAALERHLAHHGEGAAPDARQGA